MLNVFFRKQVQIVKWLKFFCQKLTYANSSLVRSELTLKSLIEDNRFRKQRPFKENFIENLFLNKFQETILEYPEIESLDEVKSLQNQQNLAKELLALHVNENKKISSELKPEEILANIKKLELTGLKLSHYLKGFGYLESEYMFMLEAISAYPSLSKTVFENEEFGTYLIYLFGNNEQKEMYLPKLASGESLACFAHLENQPLVPLNITAPVSLNTTAVMTSDGKNYLVSGKKNWVYNASIGDLMIVSANVKANDGVEGKSTLFLINKNLDGITVHERIKTLGLKGLDICEVSFDNVLVPITSVLGTLHEGDKYISKVLTNGKLNNGAQCIAIMRKLINLAINHCIQTKLVNKYKYERTFFQEKIGNLVSRLYTVESATYLATGRKDMHENANIFLESLIVKIYASETLRYVLQETLSILSTQVFENFNGLEKEIYDSQFFSVCDATNNHLRLILGHSGYNHVIKYQSDSGVYKKIGDFFNKQNLFRILNFKDNDRFYFSHNLKGYVHKTFEQESLFLEDSVFSLTNTTNHLINKYGNNVLERSYELKLLADMLINIYVLAATTGRASRAYCLGVRNQEIDRVITQAEGIRLYYEIKKNQKVIEESTFMFENLYKLNFESEACKFYDLSHPFIANSFSKN